MTKFYDTCSLLLAGEGLFNEEAHFVVSSISFKELEEIKTSGRKDPDTKYSARLLLRLFNERPDSYTVVVHKESYESIITETDIEINDDMRILSDAIFYYATVEPVQFITNDLSFKHIAKLFLTDVDSIPEDTDTYCGFKDIVLTDEELAILYSNPTINQFDCLINEYLIVRDKDNNILDVRCWTGEEYRYLKFNTFNSMWFGAIKPYSDDIYQKIFCDSLANNQITMVKGKAGTGKTYLSLGYLMSQMERGKIDKIIVFCNTVATANSARLGFYPGTRIEKLLDSQIGNLLTAKFGGVEGVEELIGQDKLVLLPMSDIRGYDTSGMHAGVYISEAQNLDRALIKLALQRIGEDCICIIDGDEKTQVDDIHYAGNNNGMRRMSKVFRNHDIYGEVELKTIHRSQIAQIAEDI